MWGKKGKQLLSFIWGFFFLAWLCCSSTTSSRDSRHPLSAGRSSNGSLPRPSLGSSSALLVAEAPPGPQRLLSQPPSLNPCHPSHLARRGIPRRAQGAHPAHEIQQRGGDGGVRLHGVVHHQDGGLWKERAAACTPCALPAPSGPALCPRGAEGNPFLRLLQPFSSSSS